MNQIIKFYVVYFIVILKLINLTNGYTTLDEYSFKKNATNDRFHRIENHVKINLYYKTVPDSPYRLTLTSIPNAPVDRNASIKIIIHGWLNKADNLWVLRMKDKHFLKGNYNVITINWNQAYLDYLRASRSTKSVGHYVAKVLILLIQNKHMDFGEVQIIGHCLGAHVAGFVGKKVQRDVKMLIGRITALDPARNLYEFPMLVPKSKRLSLYDALFVDVIHTSAGTYGFKRAIGHADFYPNSGKSNQPGCHLFTKDICSRRRAYLYYTESIMTDNFLATPCSSWLRYKKGKCDDGERVVMGLNANSTIRGPFYLRTNGHEPYSKG